MSSCLLTAGVTKQCAHEFGGLKELYIGNFSEVTSTELDLDGQISGFTMSSSGATFYTFEYIKDTGQALEELQENLKDIFGDLTGGHIPGVRKVAELQIA